MAGKLITLPVRIWFRSARLITRVSFDAAGKAVSLAGQTIGITSSNGSSSDNGRQAGPATAETGWREESVEQPVSPVDVEHPHDEPESRPAAAQPRETAGRRPRPVSAVRPPVAEPEVPAAPEPVHVSEEPELVREVAEPGAEDGAGAAVTVMEPWAGYGQMSARDVIARAQQASSAELAAVRLYESRHRSRQTVLAAVDRQLKLATGGPQA